MTDQPKWTPGPWQSSAAAEELPYGVMPRIYSADGTLLAEVGNVRHISDASAWTLDQDAWEANAKLIAAAPDLAKALEYYADTFCEGFCKDLPQAGTYQPEMDLDCSGCKARAALAKARGQA